MPWLGTPKEPGAHVARRSLSPHEHKRDICPASADFVLCKRDKWHNPQGTLERRRWRGHAAPRLLGRGAVPMDELDRREIAYVGPFPQASVTERAGEI